MPDWMTYALSAAGVWQVSRWLLWCVDRAQFPEDRPPVALMRKLDDLFMRRELTAEELAWLLRARRR